MKLLHDVRATLVAPIWFFSNDNPCPNTYHNGFGDERRDPALHAECIRVINNPTATERDITGFICGCRICTEPMRHSVYHYFLWNHRNPEAPPEINGYIVCPNCIAGICPTPDQGNPIDRYIDGTPMPTEDNFDCEHRFRGTECENCGTLCNHEDAFDDGICVICEYRCPHEGDFTETDLCVTCNWRCEHITRANGQCVTCGTEFFDD